MTFAITVWFPSTKVLLRSISLPFESTANTETMLYSLKFTSDIFTSMAGIIALTVRENVEFVSILPSFALKVIVADPTALVIGEIVSLF